ncbi:MAG: gfo/Idh/MocA family oxidoreductase, partial [Bacteroidetes bacterium]
KLELETFAHSIQHNQRPKVSGEDGYRALLLAHRIEQTIAQSPQAQKASS